MSLGRGGKWVKSRGVQGCTLAVIKAQGALIVALPRGQKARHAPSRSRAPSWRCPTDTIFH